MKWALPGLVGMEGASGVDFSGDCLARAEGWNGTRICVLSNGGEGVGRHGGQF